MSARDVTAAYRYATAEVRVQFPPGALLFDNVWKFSVCGKAWDSAGFGNRRTSVQIRPRRLRYCGGARVGTGGRLLNVITQVRFLPPQLAVPLAERLKAPVLQTGQAGSIPAGHFAVHCRDDRGSANGRLPGFEPGGGGSNPSPRASHRVCSGAVAVGSDAWL